MKKIYYKPQIVVETMSLDEPIAAGCEANKENMLLLQELGCFLDKETCSIPVLETGGFDWDGDGISDMHDTVCYHANVEKAFMS